MKESRLVGKEPNVSPDALYIAGIIASFIVGIAFRTYHLFSVGFDKPYNLGGLFYQMSLEIMKNNFRLPALIPYYYPGGLPFAYPPLPFYIQAALIKLFSPGLFVTVNLFPPLFSILSILAFYLLAQKVIHNRLGQVAAVFTFAIIPVAFLEQIEAMGLAESLGTLALVLYCYTLLRAADKESLSAWILPGGALGLCIISSPGAIYAAILISLLFFATSLYDLVLKKASRKIMGCLLVGSMGILVSFPYWYTVISNHGLGIFFNSFAAQNSSLFEELIADVLGLRVIFASPFWNIIFLCGFIAALVKKHYVLAIFSILMLLIPRENWIMAVPASLLIGIGVVELLGLLGTITKKRPGLLKVGVIWALALFFCVDSALFLLSRINSDIYDISKSQLEDLAAIRESGLIPPSGPVLVLGNWGLIEWVPALLQRDVINNPFGLEWVPENYQAVYDFSENILQVKEPGPIIDFLENGFKELDRVFVLTDPAQLNRLGTSYTIKSYAFAILEEYETLGLGVITSLNDN